MSKRWGNVINPDEMVNKYGADSLRVYEMFMGPFTQSIAWSTDGVKGARRFLERIYKYSPTWLENETLETESQISRTIKKVTEDITGFRFNTAIATLMTFVNHLYENNSEGNAITRETLEKFLVLLSPFAPHLAEELWEKIGNNESIFKANWPVFDSKLIVDELLTVAVQINGKIRDQVLINKGAKEVEVLKLAQNSEKAAKYLNGAKIVKVVYVPDKLLSLVIK
jgi:leucyl-tRNA synthetase